jgi:ABC-type bacteriocin/lantibiotic exporter with double-glycine peptidase domain
MDVPIIRIVFQRAAADCGVACLAMLLGLTYENVLVAVAQDNPDVCAEGMYLRDFRRAARRLGYRLSARRVYDLDADTGLLRVDAKKWSQAHVVVLREGLIIDTDGTLFDADVYLASKKARPGYLLVAEAA